MKAYIWVTFGLLGFGYYQASGGADFEPGKQSVAVFAAVDALEAKPLREVAAADPASDEALLKMEMLSVTAELAPIQVAQFAIMDTTSVVPIKAVQPANAVDVSDVVVLAALRTIEAMPDEMSPVAEAAASEKRVSLVLPVESSAPESALKAEPDLRAVNGTRVNLRDGPSTDHGVVAKLGLGTEVEVLEDPGDGWVRLQVLPEGEIGWTADFLLDQS
ncbi:MULTISPECIES: SH3 domain-containing protein [unclassified Marinovum]